MSQVLDRSKWVESAFIPYQAATACPPGPALVLAPHADDEVLGCAGAILSHLVAGDAVSVVIATDSDYGQFPAGMDGCAERRREAQAAAATLGYGQPIFWGLPDRGLVYDEALIGRVLAVLEASAAAILYAPSWWEIHPDHCVLALAAVEAARRCPRAVMLVLYEVGVPLHPNRLLDLTGLVERKQAALKCYESQLKMQPYDQQIMALHRYRSYTLPARVKFAEAFRMLRQEELQQDPLRAIRPGLYYAQSMPTTGLAPPLVSVLYIGGRAGLAEALDSVMIQTHAHVEVLVIVDRRGDAPVQEEDLIPWQGARFPVRVEVIDGPSSRPKRANLAMASARGDWLAILDEGESLEPDHLARLVELLGRGGRSRCVCTGVRLLRVKTGTQEDTDVPADAGDGADSGGLADAGGGTDPGVLAERGAGQFTGVASRCQDWFLPPAPRGPEAFLAVPLGAVLFARDLFQEGCRLASELDAPLDAWDFWLQLSHRSLWLLSPVVTMRKRQGEPASEMLAWPGQGIVAWPGGIASLEVATVILRGWAESRQARTEPERWVERVLTLANALQTEIKLGRQMQAEEATDARQADGARWLAAVRAVNQQGLAQRIANLETSNSRRLPRPFRTLVQWFCQGRMGRPHV